MVKSISMHSPAVERYHFNLNLLLQLPQSDQLTPSRRGAIEKAPTTEWNEMDRERSDCAAKQCEPWGGSHQRRGFWRCMEDKVV